MGLIKEFRARRLEQREGYSDMVLFAHQNRINSVSAPLSTAAAELAAGQLGRALAAAELTPEGSRAEAATKAWRQRCGRDLIFTGEHMSLIDSRNGMFKLWPATSWTFHDGNPDPDSWIIDLQIPSPKGTITVRRPWSGVVCLLWAQDPAQPWRGISPFQSAQTTSHLLGGIERGLASEAAGPVGHLIPIPRVSKQSISELKSEVAGINGTSMLVESLTKNTANNTSNEYTSRRIGANPPPASVTLRQHAEASLLAAAGTDVSLISGTTAGNAKRELYRQWLHTVVSPIGEQMEAELSNKLTVPKLSINFAPLQASDMAGKARAAASLVKSGWTPEEAAEVVGIDPPSSTQPPELEMIEQ